MLEITRIRNERAALLQGLKVRNWSDEDLGMVDQLLELDQRRRTIKTDSEQLAADANRKSKEIGALYKSGKKEEAERLRKEVADSKETAKAYAEQLKGIEEEMQAILFSLPNIPHTSVPAGNSDEDNEVAQDWGADLPELGADALPHWELAKNLEIFDLDLGVKLTGAGFPVYIGKGAKLQRALISFFLDQAAEAGYKEILPPLLVNEDTARATGQLPDKEGQMYYVERDNLYLIPTAEVPVTNVYRDVILEEADFPVKLCGYTPCFRREAGSYGAHVRGLNRVHQFDKVEIVQIAHPDRSYEALDGMVAHVEGVLKKLELPYRILRLCGGDLGFTSALTFDFEVYSAAQKRWLEVSSVSNFETFQANRLKLRYRSEKGNVLAHTLNGSALALARIVAAVLENNQKDGVVHIPKVLQAYTGFDRID